MIKAIETKYKGYRFRSRLEARWAVFFETAGYEWVYEPEGFDLGGGDYYLPDFLVRPPSCQYYSYVEIKPWQEFDPFCKAIPIYLAGPIFGPRDVHAVNEMTGEEEWFCDLSDWRNLLAENIFYEKYKYSAWIGSRYRFRKGYEYTGPHYIDNHATFRHHAYKANISAIHKSQIIFAWIDREECYGTIAEIGYAKAMGRKILLGLSSKLKRPGEYDFVRCFAKESVDGCDSVVDAWNKLMPPRAGSLSEEERKVSRLSELLLAQMRENYTNRIYGERQNIIWVDLVHGDPFECTRWRYEAGTCFARSLAGELEGGSEEHQRVATIARQARFEHGENG